MVGCGTPQGAARFKFRRGKEYGPTETPTSGLSNNLILRDYSMDFNRRRKDSSQ